ncbi:MAG TPA: FAD-dependent oxidoreductase [Polyangiaceae bacterium]|nr:FAD-dependent oxidoreductase [Polyangiaceae bacterium]
MSRSERRFHPARLAARSDAGGGMTRMTLDVALEVARTYTAPGQYIEVRADDQTGLFVLADVPGAPAWELIMRLGGGASDVLLAAPVNASLRVSEAIGPGFPMQDASGQPLIVALAGTGIAAGRPIVRRRVIDGDAARTVVYVGIRTARELPVRGELFEWMRGGVDVIVCLSQRDGAVPEIPSAPGRVQDVLRARGVASPSITRVFAVGPPSMVDALKDLASEWGIAPERVYTNY